MQNRYINMRTQHIGHVFDYLHNQRQIFCPGGQVCSSCTPPPHGSPPSGQWWGPRGAHHTACVCSLEGLRRVLCRWCVWSSSLLIPRPKPGNEASLQYSVHCVMCELSELQANSPPPIFFRSWRYSLASVLRRKRSNTSPIMELIVPPSWQQTIGTTLSAWIP